MLQRRSDYELEVIGFTNPEWVNKYRQEVKMENEKVIEKLGSWDDFVSGTFLKAINVTSEKDAFICVDVSLFTDKDNTTRPRLDLERNGKDFEFDLNKTNAVFLANQGITSPKALVGKKIYFRKALVRNPKTNQEVEGLRICKVE